MAATPRHDGEPSEPRETRLDSWKEIAAYLRRDVSTVRRWEKREGLPVHRHFHDRLGSVYAFAPEIDRWWQSRQGLEGSETPDDVPDRPAVAGESVAVPVRADGTRPVAPAVVASRTWPLLVGCVVGLTLLGAAYRLAGTLRGHATSDPASIAVLPLAGGTGNPDAEVLIDTLTEGIISSLSEAPGLEVISRTSAFRYKGKGIVPRQVGRELDVHTLLVGQVLHRGDGSLSVSVELIDARDDRRLWGTTFEGSVKELGAVQEHVVRHVVRMLTGRADAGTNRYARSAEAHELYLRGRYHWNKRTLDGLHRAVSAFQEAVDRDPTYAPAFAGLADSYTLLGYYQQVIPFGEARSKTRAAAVRALALDDSLAEAHTSMASVREYADWDWSGAEREYKRAIQLNPNYATAYHWYMNHLSLRGHHDAAIRTGSRAIELDPLSPILHVALGYAYFQAGRYDESIRQLQKALVIEPGFANAYQFLGLAYERQRRYDEALAEMLRAAELHESWVWKANRAHLYVSMGRRHEAIAIVREFERRRPHVSLATTAALHAAVGERDRALVLLERACAARDPDLPMLLVGPAFDRLIGDHAFQAILRRIGLS
jgi:TolB-like protein/Flp pilus assembly protein TadD